MRYLVGLYGTTVLIAAIYFGIWGDYAYKGFFNNLGRAVVWPAIAFPSFGSLLTGLIWVVVIGGLLLFARSK